MYNDYNDYASAGGFSESWGKQPIKRCYHDHPPLNIGGFLVYGGSCSSPVIKDADVYIGFDMSMQFTNRSWPWLENPIQEVYFYIRDMGVPDSREAFVSLVEWAASQIKAGKKVHAGCIGGHGRTGTFLAALVTYMTGELDSISYVRKHYCTKAVESEEQVEFLSKHFGIKAVASSKPVHKSYPAKKAYKVTKTKPDPAKVAKAKASPNQKALPFSSPMGSKVPKAVGGRVITHVPSKKSIWREE